PWLRDDPRPFPIAEDCLWLDGLAKTLAQLHTLRDQFESAIRDLRRIGQDVAGLEEEAAKIRERIKALYWFLTVPKTGRNEEGHYSRSIAMPIKNEGDYYFFNSRPLPQSRLIYLGFKCPRCRASVAQRKGHVDWGQRYDRMVISSCFCLTYSTYQPRGFQLAP